MKTKKNKIPKGCKYCQEIKIYPCDNVTTNCTFEQYLKNLKEKNPKEG